MRSSKLAAAAVLSLLFAVSACGGSGGTPTGGPAATTPAGQPTAAGGGPTTPTGGEPTKAPGGGTDSCSLLSIAELKTATGFDFPAGIVDTDGTCTWELTVDPYGNVSLSILSNAGLAATKTAIPGGADTTISGHAAYWGPTDNFLQGIWVEIGSDLLYIGVTPAPRTDPHGVTQKLAESAVAHM